MLFNKAEINTYNKVEIKKQFNKAEINIYNKVEIKKQFNKAEINIINMLIQINLKILQVLIKNIAV